jgi:hypothetical protein
MPFSETIEELLREVDPYDYEIYWSHGRGVPDCLNVPTNQAMKNKKNTHFWFVDDDMQLPKGVLRTLVEADTDVIACDYPVSADGIGSTLYDPDGNAFFSGSGCLLVKREVLENLKKPYWRADVGWRLSFMPDFLSLEAGAQNPDKVYGQQDVNFGLRLYAKGTPIRVSDVTCGQRKLKKLGNWTDNQGGHEVVVWRKFHKNSFYIHDNETKRTPARGMVEVKLHTGEWAQAKLDHARQLYKNGLATQIGHAKFVNWDIATERILV